jgi:GT2 family glycosyltransferase
MPLAAKKNQRTEKVTPAQLDAEELPVEQVEEAAQLPLVTVLVYSYNNATALRRCLAALEQSTGRSKMEILVVDKGSQDESPTLDAEFTNTTFLRLPRNFGNTKALNIAMRTGVGELVFFLNPDIEVAPDTISKLVEHLEADTDAVAVCPLIVNEKGTPVPQVYRLPSPQTGTELAVLLNPQNDPITVEYATFQAMLARKYFIRGINYFDERYGEFGADAELSFQVKRAGRTIKVLPWIQVMRTGSPARPSSSAENLLVADRIHGIAVYLGKHHGFFSGLTFRISEIIKALLSFRLGLFASLITDSKIDGSQGVIL